MTDQSEHQKISVRRLSSGFSHIRGRGPCNWAQPPCYPCAEAVLREHAFPAASEEFIQTVLRAMRRAND